MSEPPTIRARLLAHWPIKLWLGAALSVVFTATYLAVQRLPAREPILLRPTAIDRLIPFDERWVWPYLSFDLLVSAAWLATTRDELRRYAVGFVLIMLVGLLVFMVWPTHVPRPAVESPGEAYRWLVAIDRPLNCLPSQHVALATYTTLFAWRVLGRGRSVMVTLLAAWTLVIAYATLAIKQHYVYDLAAGAALGIAGHGVAWRGARGAA